MSSPGTDAPAGRGLSRRSVERVVAALLVGVAALVLWDSFGRGAGWASDGPQSGYFPARIGLLMLAGSAVALWSSIRADDVDVFVTYVQLRRVLQVFGPLLLYVACIGTLGIYVSSGLFMAGMMAMLGGFRAWQIGAAAVLTPVAFFVVFEIWFAVPLPKGPLEAMLGY